MLLLLALACDSGGDDSGSTDTSSADTADTNSDGDTDNDSDTDTDSDSDTDTAHTGDTGESSPIYLFTAGTTGVQLDFTYTGTPGASDVIRYGLWNNSDMQGEPGAIDALAAVFPATVVAEVAAGMWYCGAFLDVDGDSTTGPGTGDYAARWASSGDVAWGIEVRDGYTTSGVTLDFTQD